MDSKRILTVIALLTAVVLLVVLVVLNRDRLFVNDEAVVTGGVMTLTEEDAETTPLVKVVRKKVAPPPGSEDGGRTSEEVQKSPYERLGDEVRLFFSYLDGRNYVKSYRLQEDTYPHALGIISKLTEKPPVVTGETRDIYLLARNMAHFYRVIGRRDIRLIKDVLSHEREIVEPAMEMFYEWMMGAVEGEKGDLSLTIENVYDYGAFFLNTVSGKAYLLRRQSRIRMLMTYYSILIVDRANALGANRYGIDILPALELLKDDMNSYTDLEYRQKYIERLTAIQETVRTRS